MATKKTTVKKPKTKGSTDELATIMKKLMAKGMPEKMAKIIATKMMKKGVK